MFECNKQDIKALLMCSSVPKLLGKHKQLTIHSVFKRACNITTVNGSLLTLLSRTTTLTPRGIVLQYEDLSEVFTQGQLLNIKDKCLITSKNTIIDFRSTPSEHTQIITQPDPRRLALLASTLGDFIKQSPPKNGMYSLITGEAELYSPKLINEINNSITNLKLGLTNSDVLLLKKSLHNLIGLGIGLTPSGDDFILGVLFMMDYMKVLQHPLLIDALDGLHSRTTLISAAMLINGCDGRYSLLLHSLLTCKPSQLYETFFQVTAYGHSSGHDMLCGVNFALACFPAINTSSAYTTVM